MATATQTALLPSEAEARMAKDTGAALASHLQNTAPLRIALLDGPHHSTIKLPVSAVKLLVRILEEMSQGNAVALTTIRAELTTQEAAEVLNISRPSVIQLLDEGKIEFRKVGTHRRVRFESLIAYKRKAEADRRAVLEQLSAYDQELGM